MNTSHNPASILADVTRWSVLGRSAVKIQLGQLDTVGHRNHLDGPCEVVCQNRVNCGRSGRRRYTPGMRYGRQLRRLVVLFGTVWSLSFCVPGSYGHAACNLSAASGMRPADRIGGFRRKCQ